MSLGDMVDTLTSKHHALEEAIEKQNNRPLPDDIEIASLKKQKLRIKDELASMDADSV
ncbi:MAG: YdcH family protein [Rhodospirillales bacterium]|nr:YdcH family protein [Rhodospirillales bacterium]